MTGYTKLTAYVTGGMVLVVAAFFVLVRPTLNRVSELTEEERTTRAEVNRLEQQILAYKTAQSDLSKATKKDLLYSVVVNDKNLHMPIEEMERAAQATGSTYILKINRDSLDDVPPAKKVTLQTQLEEVPYTLTIQNPNFSNLLTFFQYLENIPRFTEVSQIDLSIQTLEETKRKTLTATINGVFLAKKDESKPKTQPQPQAGQEE